jgi:RNA polymerase sigma-70 factor (ECF subfamily)
MSATATATLGPAERELLAAARAGDGEAFRALLAPHLRPLHVHCYRMLGSYQDAEDAVQETLIRAWRALDSYEGRAPLRHWLYRISTTTCLKILEGRSRRPATVDEVDHLEPYADRLLDQLPRDGDPAAVAERRESVSLAFIAAVQTLPATQNAVVILRDVLSWSSAEVAQLLDTSVPAVNSALQRARETLRTAMPAGPPRRLGAAERAVVTGFVQAWNRRDIDALAALLREDVIMRMPPERVKIVGRLAVTGFFATVPADGLLETLPLAMAGANGQPAVLAVETDDQGGSRPYGLMVMTVAEDGIAAITGFPAVGGLDDVLLSCRAPDAGES